MSRQNEPAGVWVRVSTADQSEASQVPDIERHCEAHGYRIAKRYELNDKSASKGEQQATLDEMVEDIRNGVIKILVCWHSDRLERRGSEYLQRDIRLVKDAGGRIESTKEPWLGQSDISGEVMTSIAGTFAHQHIVHLTEQVKLSHDRIRVNEAVGPGSAPWGFDIVGDKYNKKLIPTDLCRVIVPRIFARCIAGDSCQTIAKWLDAEGIPAKRGSKWHQGSVLKMLHNRAYAGRWQDADKTVTLSYCEAVIPADVFDRAQESLKRRPARGPVDKDNHPMLANLRCARCADDGIDSPMFRIRLKSRSGRYYWYYRCTGRGAQRHGCGNMVPMAKLDQLIRAWVYLGQTVPYRTRQWVEGKNYDAEISNLTQDIHEVAQNPLAEGAAVRFADLTAKLAELTELNEHRERGHFEPVDTGKTIAEHFADLDDAGKRAYLADLDIAVEKGIALNGAKGARLVIDGQDYGVWPYIDATA